MVATTKVRPWSIACTCSGKGHDGNGCGATLRVTKRNAYERTWDGPVSGTPHYSVTFYCRRCGVETDIGDIAIDLERSHGIELTGNRPSEERRRRRRALFARRK